MKPEITYGYDRHERSWCVIVYGCDGYEIESHYIGTKEGCAKIIDELKEKYEGSNVIKYKAY